MMTVAPDLALAVQELVELAREGDREARDAAPAFREIA